MEIKSEKMLKSFEFFLLFFSKLQVLSKWIFSFSLNLIQSARILQRIMEKALFLRFSRSPLITYLINLSLEKEIIVLEKKWKNSWILYSKISTNPDRESWIIVDKSFSPFYGYLPKLELSSSLGLHTYTCSSHYAYMSQE